MSESTELFSWCRLSHPFELVAQYHLASGLLKDRFSKAPKTCALDKLQQNTER